MPDAVATDKGAGVERAIRLEAWQEVRTFIETLKTARNLGELEASMHPLMLTTQAIDGLAPRASTRRGAHVRCHLAPAQRDR